MLSPTAVDAVWKAPSGRSIFDDGVKDALATAISDASLEGSELVGSAAERRRRKGDKACTCFGLTATEQRCESAQGPPMVEGYRVPHDSTTIDPGHRRL